MLDPVSVFGALALAARAVGAAEAPNEVAATVRAAASRAASRSLDRMRRSLSEHAFDLEQHALALHSAAVAAEPAAGVQHAVAGDDDRDRVGAERVAGGTVPARAPCLRG